MDKRAAFYRLDTTTDDYGGVTQGFAGAAFLTVWCRVEDDSGRERLEGGALSAVGTARLLCRDSTDIDGVTAADRVIVEGVTWNIRHIDRTRGREGRVTMHLEKGVA